MDAQPMTDELKSPPGSHTANNLRVRNQMTAELLAVATQRNLPGIEAALFFELFSPRDPNLVANIKQ